ncbi:hypothetical protein JIR23_14220 [Bradyrhizobium diazoefficiens]|nr:hypothetical protein [Bradyrhizobium diazoefficiens]QQN66751.1 hypothetical protein JIR23_14220 [Bradyrhizobium diazoefficiens]
MRKVVDTNSLKSDELKGYLADAANVAVLPDFVIMEALKPRDPALVAQQFQLLSERPKQIVALKTTRAVGGLRSRPRSRGLQRRLIDAGQTSAFPLFCDKIKQARDGDEPARKQLAVKCDGAIAELATIAKGQETYAANIAEHAKQYTDAELAVLRKGEPISVELLAKITGEILKLTLGFFAVHPYGKQPPKFKQLPNAFLFRYAVAGYVVALRCIKEGGPGGASAEKIRNHLVDAMLVAYATYFDGFLSADKKANELYETTSDLLKVYHQHAKQFDEKTALAQLAAEAAGTSAVATAAG